MAGEVKNEHTPATLPARPQRSLAWWLILIGVALLALRTLPIHGRLWTVWWSIVLIGLGLDLLTGSRQRSKIVVGALLAALVFSITLPFSSSFVIRQEVNHAVTQGGLPITDEAQLRTEIELTAGSLTIRALPAEADEIARLQNGGKLAYHKEAQTGVLQVEPSRWRIGNVDLALTQRLPLDLMIRLYAGNAELLDFHQLQLRHLDLRVRAGNTTIKLPASGIMDVRVDCFAGNVRIDVPRELAARVEASRVGQLDLANRFQEGDAADVFVTKNYDPHAPDRLLLRVTTRGGNIEIN